MKKRCLIVFLFLFSTLLHAIEVNDSTLSNESHRSTVSFVSFEVGSNFTFFSNYVSSATGNNEIVEMNRRARSHFALGLGLNPFNSDRFNLLFSLENNNHDLKAKTESFSSTNTIEYDFNYASIKFGGLFKLIESYDKNDSKVSLNLKAGIDANFLLSGFQYKQDDVIDLRNYQPFKNSNLDYFFGVNIQKQITSVTSLKFGYTRVNGFMLEELNPDKGGFYEQYIFKTDLFSLGVLVDLDAVKNRKQQEKELNEVAENLKNELNNNTEYKNETEQKFKKLIKQLNNSDKKIEEHADVIDQLKKLIEQEENPTISSSNNSGSLASLYSLNDNKRLVLFPFGKDKFYSAFNKELDDLVSYLDANKTFSVQLVGYTDIVGSDNFNLNLSKNRAKSVKKYLVSKGIDESKISIEYKGSTTQFDRYNFLFNRRVEINIINK